MPKDPDLERYTLNVRRGDIDFLVSVCEPRGVMVSKVIRTLISNKVDELKAKMPEQPPPAIEGIEL